MTNWEEIARDRQEFRRLVEAAKDLKSLQSILGNDYNKITVIIRLL